ncbi:non-ribosomal peptide synthetase [Clostridium felsineum]|uniref:non-ribosomal peptide synthetase n=1 Tax=Clostridium felsineum TaxID=36839 RepID=UPI0009D3754B|nr:non-ribosomal peptide synthetase [Clostridium felsineum]URZ01267.1 Polyketide synthase PksJ [Clostridium felsineum]
MYDNLCDLFVNASESDNGIYFIKGVEEEKYISYHVLYEQCKITLGGLQKLGIKRGDELVFQFINNEDFVSMFWACIIGGIIPIPITIGQRDNISEKICKVWKQLKRPHLITCEKYEQNLNRLLKAGKDKYPQSCEILQRIIKVEDLCFDNAGEMVTVCSDDIAYIQFSSGSTGDPKGVVLTHKNIAANVDAIIKGCGANSKIDSSISWLPLTHDMGLIGMHITPLALAINQYNMLPMQFIKSPLLLLDKITKYKITVTSIPNFGYNHILNKLKPGKKYDWNLSSVRVIFNGAEMISYPVVFNFIKCMKQYQLSPIAMFDVYGLAEASLAVSFPQLGTGLKKVSVNRNHLSCGEHIEEVFENCDEEAVFVQLGQPVTGCDMRIVDDNGKDLHDMEVGNIWIKGDNVTKGYYGLKEFMETVITKEGWLKTGDLGFQYHNNLVVVGRSKDVIIVNGRNYYTTDLEEIVLKLSNSKVVGVAVGGFSNKENIEEIVVFVQFYGSNQEFVDLDDKIRKSFYSKMSLYIKEVVKVSNIPRTTSGKICHYKLIDAYRNHVYDEICEEMVNIRKEKFKSREVVVPESDIEEKLVNIFKSVLSIDEIGILDDLFNYKIQSLQVVQIFQMIDEVYPNHIKLTNLYHITTIREIAELILTNTKNEKIPSVCLPDEFISIQKNRINFENMDFQMDSMLTEKIGIFTAKKGIKIGEFFEAIIGDLLWEISGTNEIEFCSTISDIDVLNKVHLSFQNYDYIEELFEYIKEMKPLRVKKEMLKGMPEEREARKARVLLLCTKETMGVFEIRQWEMFDLVWVIEEMADRILIHVKYFRGKYTRKIISLLYDIFVEIISNMISD